MATNVYECMFILDSNRYARDANAVSGTIPEMVEKCGGEVLASRLWNEQKLAYPINNHRKGTYWLTYFQMDSAQLGTFNRECQLNANVVRNLVIKVESRLAEPLVAHARGEAAPVESEVAADEPPAKAAAEDSPKAAGDSPAAAESNDGGAEPDSGSE